MRIEWDKIKSDENRRKHGISFEVAQHIFSDPRVVLFVDSMIDGEERWHGIGFLEEVPGVLIVVHTYQSEPEVIRIISARRATRTEKNLYEKANA
jgi:uncharacterized protein